MLSATGRHCASDNMHDRALAHVLPSATTPSARLSKVRVDRHTRCSDQTETTMTAIPTQVYTNIEPRVTWTALSGASDVHANATFAGYAPSYRRPLQSPLRVSPEWEWTGRRAARGRPGLGTPLHGGPPGRRAPALARRMRARDRTPHSISRAHSCNQACVRVRKTALQARFMAELT
jgi:hypothetical protein